MELWNLYDRDRHPTGEILERGKPVPPGRYHLVVHVVIFNSKGEMLIQQRQPFKEGWPNLWDITVGGSPLPGMIPAPLLNVKSWRSWACPST